MGCIRALITAPTQDVLTLEQVKEHLRVDSDDEDALIEGYLAAAVDHLDPAGKGWLQRALRPQTWELRYSQFPECFDLPFPPLISITSLKYDDSDGVERTLVVNTNYTIIGTGTDYPAIIPAYNTSWPSTRGMPESVRLRYQCGYPVADPDTMPNLIKSWLLLRIGGWYDTRESIVVGATIAEVPDFDRMLTRLRPIVSI